MKKPTINDLLTRIEVLDNIVNGLLTKVESLDKSISIISDKIDVHDNRTTEWRVNFDKSINERFKWLDAEISNLKRICHTHWWMK